MQQDNSSAAAIVPQTLQQHKVVFQQYNSNCTAITVMHDENIVMYHAATKGGHKYT